MIPYVSFSFFIIFFGITFFLYSLLPAKTKWISLLAGSYAFYFVSARGHIYALVLSSFVIWADGWLLQYLDDKMKLSAKEVSGENSRTIGRRYQTYRKCVLIFGVLTVLSLLFICKYSNFFLSTISRIIPIERKEVSIVQPLGISFFILEGISYIADVYLGKIRAEKNPLRVSLYLSFMLTVVEGPFARYDQLGSQLNKGVGPDIESINKGALRIMWGLFKKVVIADRAAMLVNAVFDNYESYSGIAAAASVVFYTLQLYCEFSGIMDIVSGMGSMLGIRLPDNFRQPFFARSINEFWQRWHITLGEWLRDYVFYGVLFSKKIKLLSAKARGTLSPYYANILPVSIALFFVWLANGTWHGAGWKYIAYGMYYYLLMTAGMFLEPLFKVICERLRIDRNSRGFGIFRMIRTIVIVNIGMLIFRAKDLGTAFYMLKSIFTGIDLSVLVPGYGNGFFLSIYDYTVIILGSVLLLSVSILTENGEDIKDRIYRLPYPGKVILYSAFLFVIIIFGAYGKEYVVVDMIYANF